MVFERGYLAFRQVNELGKNSSKFSASAVLAQEMLWKELRPYLRYPPRVAGNGDQPVCHSFFQCDAEWFAVAGQDKEICLTEFVCNIARVARKSNMGV